MRTDADIESLVNDLDTAEVGSLVTLVSKLDPLAVTNDGTPVYGADEINLIQRFQQFATDHPVENEDDAGSRDEFFAGKTDESGVEAESGDDPDNDGDIPGTGEDGDDVADLVAHDAKVGFPGMVEIPIGEAGPLPWEAPAGNGGEARAEVMHHNI